MQTINLTKLHFLLYLLNVTNLIFSAGNKIYKLFPDIERLFFNNERLIKYGFAKEELDKLKKPDWRLIEKDFHWMRQDNHHIITIYDDCYPALLKEISNPPFLLFAIGDLELLHMPQLAIVGSRNPTPVGIEIAQNFARELSEAGLVIVSGLAIGIDGAGHRGAMNGLGKTVAVMGVGLNNVYPKRHKNLARDIIFSGGLMLSEYPLDAQAKSWHFPMRNRIISGLSLGTLVIEAALKSGSLITARLAAEQNREVFAIPGSIYNPKARGCHYLISQGARIAESPLDILGEFHINFDAKRLKKSKSKDFKAKNKLDCEHKKLLNCIGFEMANLDVLAKRVDLPVSRVSIMLLDLELGGLIKRVVGGYIKV